MKVFETPSIRGLFQLTTSRRGRHSVHGQMPATNDFNSRPHEEVDAHRTVCKSDRFHFNSRPHEEVDYHLHTFEQLKHISTHDLTKRSTFVLMLPNSALSFQLTTSRRGRPVLTSLHIFGRSISTHDLTKRSTAASLKRISYSGLFQLTTSRRGRPLELLGRHLGMFISTHDLTKRST